MNIYLPPNQAVEDLVNTLEELKPGMVTYKLVLEVNTEDKNLATLLKTLASNVEDSVNAESLVLPRSKPEKKTRKPRMPKADIGAESEPTF